MFGAWNYEFVFVRASVLIKLSKLFILVVHDANLCLHFSKSDEEIGREPLAKILVWEIRWVGLGRLTRLWENADKNDKGGVKKRRGEMLVRISLAINENVRINR